MMSNIILSIFIFAAGIYGAMCLFLFFTQSKLLYYPYVPSREITASPADIGLQYETVSITTSDGLDIHGWFVPAKEERGTVLFFHGNAGNISHRLDSVRTFHDLGLSILIIDYRGYGRSQGSITEQGTYLDAEAAWDYLTGIRNIPARQIVVFGRSLGGAIAAYTAARQTPGALIIEAAFTSVPDMAADLYPIFPVRLLTRFQYNTKRRLRSVSSPVLIIHSTEDEIIPYKNGMQLFESAGEPKELLNIRGAHNDGFLVSEPMYSEGINNFINANLTVLDQSGADKINEDAGLR